MPRASVRLPESAMPKIMWGTPRISQRWPRSGAVGHRIRQKTRLSPVDILQIYTVDYDTSFGTDMRVYCVEDVVRRRGVFVQHSHLDCV